MIPPVSVTWTTNPDGTVTASWTAEAPFDEYTVVLDGTSSTVMGTSVGPLPGNVPHSITVTPSAADATPASADFTPPPPAGSRDALVQAYTSTSIWNQPIGSSAVRVPAALPKRTTASQVADQRVILMDPSQPLESLSGTQVPMAPKFTWTPGATQGSGNSGFAAVLADGKSVFQGGKFTRSSAGATATGTNTALFNDDLYGDGLVGKCGGTALSTLGGVIRYGEFTAGLIPHAVAINLFGSTDCSPAGGGFMWPATKADSYAEGGGSNPAYNGKNPAVKMGTLLALPASFDTSTLLSKPGKILAQALIDYGAYPVNDTARSVYALVVEAGPVGLVTAEFQTAFGMSLDTKLSDTPWARDVDTIFAFLEAITNNAPGSIGGGGTPLVPLAPPLAGEGPPPPPQIPATPANFTAKAVAGPAVDLAWSAAAGATDYPLTKDGGTLTDPTGTSDVDSAVAAGETHTYTLAARNSAGTSAPATQTVTIPTATPPPPGKLRNVVLIMEENASLSGITATLAPYLTGRMKLGAVATKYYAASAPYSRPNYIALASGSEYGTTDDSPPTATVLAAKSLANLLDGAGIPWLSICEGQGSDPTKNTNVVSGQVHAGNYAERHNLFRQFTYCLNQPKKLIPYPLGAGGTLDSTSTAFWNAWQGGFAVVTPNIYDDGHTPAGSSGVQHIDQWLASEYPKILACPAMQEPGSLIVVTFDNGAAGASILCLFDGPAAAKGVTDATVYGGISSGGHLWGGHYCLLHTLEVGFGVGTLTANDAAAVLMTKMLA